MATRDNEQQQNREDDRGGTHGRGFASMDEDKQREIASQGGKAAHEKGTAHEFTPEEAREAGHKGGKAAHEKGTAHEARVSVRRRPWSRGTPLASPLLSLYSL